MPKFCEKKLMINLELKEPWQFECHMTNKSRFEKSLFNFVEKL